MKKKKQYLTKSQRYALKAIYGDTWILMNERSLIIAIEQLQVNSKERKRNE